MLKHPIFCCVLASLIVLISGTSLKAQPIATSCGFVSGDVIVPTVYVNVDDCFYLLCPSLEIRDVFRKHFYVNDKNERVYLDRVSGAKAFTGRVIQLDRSAWDFCVINSASLTEEDLKCLRSISFCLAEDNEMKDAELNVYFQDSDRNLTQQKKTYLLTVEHEALSYSFSQLLIDPETIPHGSMVFTNTNTPDYKPKLAAIAVGDYLDDRFQRCMDANTIRAAINRLNMHRSEEFTQHNRAYVPTLLATFTRKSHAEKRQDVIGISTHGKKHPIRKVDMIREGYLDPRLGSCFETVEYLQSACIPVRDGGRSTWLMTCTNVIGKSVRIIYTNSDDLMRKRKVLFLPDASLLERRLFAGCEIVRLRNSDASKLPNSLCIDLSSKAVEDLSSRRVRLLFTPGNYLLNDALLYVEFESVTSMLESLNRKEIGLSDDMFPGLVQVETADGFLNFGVVVLPQDESIVRFLDIKNLYDLIELDLANN